MKLFPPDRLAVVGDNQPDPIVAGFQRDAHLAGGSGVINGVHQQIAYQDLQPVRIPPDSHRRCSIQIRADCHVPVAGHGTGFGHRLRQQVVQQHGLATKLLIGIESGKGEQLRYRVDSPAHPGGNPLQHDSGILVAGLALAALDLRLDGRQRCLQLVGGVGRKASLTGQRPLEAIQQPVERIHHGFHLRRHIRRVDGLQSLGLARSDFLRQPIQRAQPPADPPEQNPRGYRQDNQQGKNNAPESDIPDILDALHIHAGRLPDIEFGRVAVQNAPLRGILPISQPSGNNPLACRRGKPRRLLPDEDLALAKPEVSGLLLSLTPEAFHPRHIGIRADWPGTASEVILDLRIPENTFRRVLRHIHVMDELPFHLPHDHLLGDPCGHQHGYQPDSQYQPQQDHDQPAAQGNSHHRNL